MSAITSTCRIDDYSRRRFEAYKRGEQLPPKEQPKLNNPKDTEKLENFFAEVLADLYRSEFEAKTAEERRNTQ